MRFCRYKTCGAVVVGAFLTALAGCVTSGGLNSRSTNTTDAKSTAEVRTSPPPVPEVPNGSLGPTTPSQKLAQTKPANQTSSTPAIDKPKRNLPSNTMMLGDVFADFKDFSGVNLGQQLIAMLHRQMGYQNYLRQYGVRDGDDLAKADHIARFNRALAQQIKPGSVTFPRYIQADVVFVASRISYVLDERALIVGPLFEPMANAQRDGGPIGGHAKWPYQMTNCFRSSFKDPTGLLSSFHGDTVNLYGKISHGMLAKIPMNSDEARSFFASQNEVRLRGTATYEVVKTPISFASTSCRGGGAGILFEMHPVRWVIADFPGGAREVTQFFWGR